MGQIVWRIAVHIPRLQLSVNGGGDVPRPVPGHLPDRIQAGLARVPSSVFAIMEQTRRAGVREIRLVEAQQASASPAGQFR